MSPPAGVAERQMRAWLLLVGAVALHVVDEAATGFLDFYNPLVSAIRSRAPWFPMPTFTFGVWLGGLVVGVVVVGLLAPVVRRGAIGTQAACWAVSGLMTLNGLAHLGASVYFREWVPGTTTAPLLLVAGGLLAQRTWERAQRGE